MVIVVGKILVQSEKLDEALEHALAHVARSRGEDGCIDHTVSIDQENPLVLRFVEYWRDEAALKTHFAVPAANDFVAAIRPLLAGPSELKIFNAEEVPSG